MARRKINDEFTKLAQREGYAARSAYKLLHIQERYEMLKQGDRVLDLGCAPGSWLQVAVQLVGSRGIVAGIDLKPVRVSLGQNVHTVEGDAFGVSPADLLALAGVREYDVVLSDMAPNTTGDPRSDHFRSINLAEQTLEMAPLILRRGGSMVIKVFEGEAYPDFLKSMMQAFRFAKGFRPKATRDVSREMFVVARGLKMLSRRPLSAPEESESDHFPESP